MIVAALMSMFIACEYTFSDGLASWCVAFGSQMGSEETPPTCRIAVPSLGQRESVGNGAETKRPTGLGNDTFVMLSVLDWKR